MGKHEMNITELRDFLKGGELVTDHGPPQTGGGLEGRLLGDPLRWHRRSDVVDGQLVVRSARGRILGEFPLSEVSRVVSLSVFLKGWFIEHPSVKTWLVGEGGRPLAEIPWGNTVQKQILEAGIPVSMAQGVVEKSAFKELRPEQQLE